MNDMPSTETILLRLLLALVLGGIVGLEREFRDKSAGFRTLTLISVGSCLFTIISFLITSNSEDRIAANIVTGIGFLGAGVIFKSPKGVNGLTTAASIWAVAALGMGAGAGYYVISIASCLAIFLILVAFNPVEDWLDRINKERAYRLVCPYEENIVQKYEAVIRSSGLSFRPTRRVRRGNQIEMHWEVRGRRRCHEKFIGEMLKEKGVNEFEF